MITTIAVTAIYWNTFSHQSVPTPEVSAKGGGAGASL